MEQLVALPFQEGTVLLSYADDLALVVTGQGNHLSGAQRALDLITAKCEKLGLKISAEKSRAMAIKAANPAGQRRVQGIGLACVCVMQSETRLVPLATRVDYIETYHVARILHRDA